LSRIRNTNTKLQHTIVPNKLRMELILSLDTLQPKMRRRISNENTKSYHQS